MGKEKMFGLLKKINFEVKNLGVDVVLYMLFIIKKLINIFTFK